MGAFNTRGWRWRSVGWRGCVVVLMLLTLVTAVTAQPQSVTVAGTMQQSMGCPENFDPTCPVTRMTYTARDDVWRLTRFIPSGPAHGYLYGIDQSLDESYGARGDPNGSSNVLLPRPDGIVKFYFRYPTNGGFAEVGDSVSEPIVVATGEFQSELGCPDDWQGDCLWPWLRDEDDDGIYRVVLEAPRGTYFYRFALDEVTLDSFGQGGQLGGASYELTLDADCPAFEIAFVRATRIGSSTCIPGVFHDGFEALPLIPVP